MTNQPVAPGQQLWTPAVDGRDKAVLGRFLRWLAETKNVNIETYQDLWRWSVTDLEGFWAAVWEFFGVRASAPYSRVLAGRQMPGAQWFPEARLNYAEHAFGPPEDDNRIALVGRSEARPPVDLTYRQLRDQVARAQAGLIRLGVGPGDRVVGYLPNIPETVVAFLATASIGAVWACSAPELAAHSVVERFSQLRPTVLLTTAGYRYGGKHVDRREDIAEIRRRLPTLRTVVDVPLLGDPIPEAETWHDLLGQRSELRFEQVPATHPLYILFSSGTTGKPKAIVHGHGGILVEHLKNHGLSWDLQPGDQLMFFTTTAWMVWNAVVSTLLMRASRFSLMAVHCIPTSASSGVWPPSLTSLIWA